MDNDFFLIRRMKAGDEMAIDDFVHNHYRDMLQYFYHHGCTPADAEDLTQEVFARFFAALPGYRHQGKARAYLYTIAANVRKNFYRKQVPTPVDAAQLATLVEENAGTERQLTDHLLVEDALAALPDDLREVVILYYFQELRLRDIADVLSIGLSLVKYRLRRARQLLNDTLRKEAFSDDPR